jgi:tetratricopeptide (TPR) repeat protein
MTTAEEKMFQEARSAIEEGNRTRGKDLLTRLLKQNQGNPDYWLWMSGVVDSIKERRYCLNQTLKLDPQNKLARRGLIMLGDLPADESLAIPFEAQKRKWQLPPLGPVEKPAPKVPWLKVGLSFVGLVAVIILIVWAIQSNRLWLFRGRNMAAFGTAVPTPTYPASPTTTITLTPRIIEPTAPWNILQSTYTPTPIYVFTPHPIVEAFSIAMRNYQRDNWLEAIKYFNQALQSQKDAPDIYYHLGEAYFQIGELRNALTAYEEAININPDFAPGYYGRAKINLLREDSIELAIEDLLISVDLDPDYGEAYLALLQAYVKEGDIESAREYLDDVEILLPNTPLLDLAKGRIALSENEFNLAIDYTEKALEKDLTLLDAYKFLGEIFQVSGNPKASLEPLLIYARYNTSFDPEAEILLSTAYAANDKFEEAINLLNEILERDPTYDEGFTQRGVIYTAMEEYQKAFEDYAQAFKLAPKSFKACITLSEANFPLKKPGNAYQQASECQKLAKNDRELAHMFFVRAIALEELKNDVAQRDWERMLELDTEAILPEWKATAEFYLNQYYTATPSPSETPSPTSSTRTVLPTTTPTKTQTIKPTMTSSITATPTITPTK